MLRKRFFHTPIFHMHSPNTEKKVTWLELFYDLVYVAAFIQLGDAFSKNISFQTFAQSAGVFVSMWITWTGFTYYANRYTVDDFLHRTLVFLQMFCVGAMAISLSSLFKGDHLYFGLSYAFSVFIIAILYIRAFIHQKLGRDYALYWGGTFFTIGFIWIVSLFFTHYYIGWILGCSVIFIAPLLTKARYMNELYPIDFEHLFERYGLLTIIVLGESFVKVLSHLSSVGGGAIEIFQASFALLLTCSIWWIYFDDIAHSHLKNTRNAMVTWLFMHVPLQFAIVLMGVGIKKVVSFPLDETIPFKYAILLGGAIGTMLVSAGIIDSVTARKNSELSDSTRIASRLIAGVLITVLALTAHTMSNAWFIGGCLFVCIFQVVFDIFFSPYDLDIHHNDTESSENFAKKLTTMPHDKVRNVMNLDVIRKGLPSNFRKDLYFYFVEATWAQLFIALFFVYILSNIFFAGLYLLTPESIANSTNTFADAFFFSIQTMSTIGYGTLSPTGFYSNLIVTIEAAFGLVGVAVITGLIFAKISRPNAKILFSQNMIYSKIDGKPSLSFRVSNARGNDIIEANMTLTALVDEVTTEGFHTRRIKGLKLVRKNTPFFRMSWSLTHVVDENSPLYGVDLDSGRVMMIVANFVGYDGTYSNTIYAQHNYHHSDIVKDKYFEDILHHLPDGRMLIDYEKFHRLRDR